MHPLPKIDGCNCTHCTRSNEVPVINYNVIEKNNEVFFKYVPKKIKQKNFTKKSKKESPFGVLKNLNF